MHKCEKHRKWKKRCPPDCPNKPAKDYDGEQVRSRSAACEVVAGAHTVPPAPQDVSVEEDGDETLPG
jgi:hypothetical protein